MWRMHKWENKGILQKGSVVAQGYDEEIGRDISIMTKSLSTRYECRKCGEVIYIIGNGPPPRFGCRKSKSPT